jgi:signal transduction histidine kinase
MITARGAAILPSGRDANPDRDARRSGSGWAQAVVTVGTLVVMLAAVCLREGRGFAFPGVPLLVFTLAAWLPLTLRIRWPLPVLVVTVVVHALQMIVLPTLDPGWESPVSMAAYQPVPIATAVGAFTVALLVPHRTAWLASGIAAVVLPLTALVTRGGEYLWTNLVMFNLILDGAAIGALISGRRERLARDARERAEATRRVIEAERLRIARELHDVLAHHLTLVNAQAGVADYLVRTDPQAAATALHGLTEHTSRALDEMRATVGLLRASTGDEDEGSDRSPLPGLDQLPQLIESVRAAGTTVELHTRGQSHELPPRADLAAYRVVQEALTNATKHAPGAPVAVALTWTEHELHIRVDNPPSATPKAPGRRDRNGHGLLGMRERVAASGGTLDVQRPLNGAFRVTATIPTSTTRTEPRPAPEPEPEPT